MAILQWIYNTIRLIHVGSMALFFLPFFAPQSFFVQSSGTKYLAPRTCFC